LTAAAASTSRIRGRLPGVHDRCGQVRPATAWAVTVRAATGCQVSVLTMLSAAISR